VLSDLLDHAPSVDNDVNWAAVAEHRQGCATDLADFAYCYLGAGMGLGLMSRGHLLHGHRGLAGEIAQVPTGGPGGQSMRLVQCFARWGLLRPGTAAIDVPALTAVLDGATAADRERRAEVVTALSGALSGVTALLNPQVLVLGGPWGGHGELPALIAAAIAADAAVPAEIRVAEVGTDAPLIGARLTALDLARSRLLRP
jgi:predicted NBD/HSP70 family sugar kinase